MNPQSLLGHCAEVLTQIERSRSTPADALVSHYTRSRKYLGAKERRALSEIVFTTLRTKNTAEHITVSLLEQSHVPLPAPALAALIGATAAVGPQWADFDPNALLDAAANSPTSLTDAFAHLYHARTQAALPDNWPEHLLRLLADLDAADERSTSNLALASCLPPWIVEPLQQQGRTTAAIKELGRALLRPAPVTLRIAPPMVGRQAVLESLEREGIAAHPTLYSPDGVVLERRVQLLEHPLYRNGILEVQDEGSQLISFALNPEPEWRILDACAGAGGKTLHIARLQNDRGSIVASDVDPARLQNLRRRLRRHRFRSIQVEMLPRLSPAEQRTLIARFDAVLLDVPCSGTGTLRRAPEIKWRLGPRQLERIIAKQERILHTYAPYVRPGGVLLYATCSILPGENECIIERFLDHHPDFVPDRLAPSFARWGIGLVVESTQWQLQLLPNVHGTDGFFIARLRRR
ncbi:MAG: SAM-dependent methyltransferase [Candidatus Kapaibacterium sp.]|nr:MAG: SAM-dependent methyltransferase [Candidatus Kapabacteria bacterium]